MDSTVSTPPVQYQQSHSSMASRSVSKALSDVTSIFGTIQRSQTFSLGYSQRRVHDRYSKPSIHRSHVRFDSPTRLDYLVGARCYSTYTKGRKKPRDDYEPSKSNREWWRPFIRETPVPGHYECKDHIGRINSSSIPLHSSFVGPGRQGEAGMVRKGEMLIPGLYHVNNFIDLMDQKKTTYSFNNSGRNVIPVGFKDKDLDTSPTQYNVKREPKLSPQPTPSSSFRSQSERFPKRIFEITDGPPPGTYNPAVPDTRLAMSSCFRSATPRFNEEPNSRKSLGPGIYSPTAGHRRVKHGRVQSAKTVHEMGRKNGTFFPIAVTVR